MKLKNIKIITFFIILFLAMGIIISKASYNASSSTVKSGEKVTIAVTSTEALESYNLDLKSYDGLTFNSCTKAKENDGDIIDINGSSIGYMNVSETTKKLGTYTFTAPEVKETKKYTVTFLVNQTTIVSTTITVEAKETTPPKTEGNTTDGNTSVGGNTTGNTTGNGNTNTSSGGTTQSKDEIPNFKNASGKVYTTHEVNLRDSWSTTSKSTLVAKGTELTLVATSTKKVNNYVWYRVTYNGQTKYIASNFVTTTKPEEPNKEDDLKNNNLSSLKVKEVTLSPSFNKDTIFYETTVSKDVKSLDIEATAESKNSTIKIEGNENLKEGENIIKITVTSKDGTSKIYTITVKKAKDEVITNNDEDLKLSKLEILGVNFENGFNPDLLSYELTLSLPVTSLTITATPNKENAKVEIIGNEGFATGENLVTVIVTSADGKETVAYQIKITVPEEVSKPVVDEMIFYGVCAIVIVVAIIIAIIVFAISRAKNKDEQENIDVVDSKKKIKENRKLEYKKIEEEQINEDKIEEEQVQKEILENNEIEEIEHKKELARSRKGRHSN